MKLKTSKLKKGIIINKNLSWIEYSFTSKSLNLLMVAWFFTVKIIRMHKYMRMGEFIRFNIRTIHIMFPSCFYKKFSFVLLMNE